MDDFTLLKVLQNELVETLQARKNAKGQETTRAICRSRIRRLRLQIQEVMLRIERGCIGYWRIGTEEWYQ